MTGLPIYILISSILLGGLNKNEEECQVLLPKISLHYEGDCKNGLAHGNGKAFGAEAYEGEFKKGYPHGKGKYYYKNGDMFIGEWKFGERNGKGEMIIELENENDSTVYGYWKNDQYMGKYNKPFEILSKRNIKNVKIVKVVSQKNEVKLKFTRLQSNAPFIDPILSGSSGIQSGGMSIYDKKFLEIQYPFEGKVDFKTSNLLGSGEINCHLRFRIYEKGTWLITIDI